MRESKQNKINKRKIKREIIKHEGRTVKTSKKHKERNRQIKRMELSDEQRIEPCEMCGRYDGDHKEKDGILRN